MNYTVLFVCLTVETADKRLFFVLCLFLADKFVCNGCQGSWKTKTVPTMEDSVFRTGSATLEEP